MTNQATKISQYLNCRHASQTIKKLLTEAEDVESNPGPQDRDDRGPQDRDDRGIGLPVLVTTYNVRGLNDENKLRHLLNYMYSIDKGKNNYFVAGLQETYIEKPGKIPYIWRGNFYLTPGAGNSCGCLTLLSPHLNVVGSSNIGNRGHLLACQRTGDNHVSLIVVNIYAPNPNTREKLNFFEDVFEKLQEFEENYDCTNSIILGDFNLTFKPTEQKNRNFSNQERRTASAVKHLIQGTSLKDVWDSQRGFTWRRPNTETFSTIDRILYPAPELRLEGLKVNWSLSCSDHAAIEATFFHVNKVKAIKSRITRLDPSLAKDDWCKTKITERFDEMLSMTLDTWDPHQKLEYAKVCVRTVCENIQAERKVKEKGEEETLNQELDLALNSLSRNPAINNSVGLIDYIEVLRGRKQELINIKGERLAEKLGTKWYNEGEKSTRYFMRLLNRALPDQFEKVEMENGEATTDPRKIEEEVVSFYRKLYETYDEVVVSDNDQDNEFFANIVPISDEDSESIARTITAHDLGVTLATCKDSAPGPDGIPYSILKLLWAKMGLLIADAWNHSLSIGKLPPSHKMSYLRLIPKVGKDLTKLTNWRPITLSNCDHKLITKTFSKRMSEVVAKSIADRQTAYLKGRLINDNVRAILDTINLTNIENAATGLIVALDAKKAFDSVSHQYIETCLRKFGCEKFVKIFKILYSELETDILLNGKLLKGYKILRGVKQGDALSCIIFIMCMEPLLRNIESNDEIRPIRSTTLMAPLPKVYAYADDVNATIADTEDGLRALFREYERLTKKSGLELNADKTELLRLGQAPRPKTYNVSYLSTNIGVDTSESVKINGIHFQRDPKKMEERNVRLVCDKIESNLRRWSRRSLSILGKILIVKTFGISQIIYLMQSMSLKNAHIKVLNALLYKFIWNRNFLAAKAPERIKRTIVNTPIKKGGLGMLNIELLDDGLKMRSLGRLLESNHPFMCLLKSKVDLSDFFDPKISVSIDSIAEKGVLLLKRHREQLWLNSSMLQDRTFLAAIGASKIRQLLTNNGRQSIPYFRLHTLGKRVISDLTLRDLGPIERYVEQRKLAAIRHSIRLNRGQVADIKNCFLIGKRFKSISSCTSKELRENLSDLAPITQFKIGMTLSNSEAINFGNRLSKITNVRHKSVILRIAHGDIYTKDKLSRYGLADSNACPRCGELEDLRHKFIECAYVKQIWRHLLPVTNVLTTSNQINEDITKAALGTLVDSNPLVLTINAEILTRILYLKEDQNFLLHPRKVIEQAIKMLHRRERDRLLKDALKDLLEIVGAQ